MLDDETGPSAPAVPPAPVARAAGAPRTSDRDGWEAAPPGTYRNPILDEDWPDPDAIRVGEDYYLIASSFNRSPGMPVLHSRDLVTWTLLTHALTHAAPDGYGGLPRHGGGVWAPAIRHHDGVFHIVYPDPDRGIFVTSATDPAGPWSAPRLLLAGLGLIDPCPLWSADGRTWLVHGWARSRSGVKNRLTMIPVDAGLTRPTGPGVVVVDGDTIPGWGTLEGPKLYERDGWYWIFAPAGGVATGFQAVLRSRDPLGPYEPRIALAQGSTPVNGPHQGALVDTPDGTDWFLHFQDRGPVGRVLHLQPVTWREGWPVMGNPVAGEAWGEPVPEHASPHGTTAGPATLAASDDFSDGLDVAWRWQADQPDDPGCPTATAAGGELRLAAPPLDSGNVRTLPSVLGQVLPGIGARLETTLRLTGPEGSRAGVGVLGRAYAWLGLVRAGDGLDVVVAERGEDDQQETRTAIGHVAVGASIGLRVDVDVAGTARLSARLPDEEWMETGMRFEVREGHWIGAELVLLAASPLGGDAGEAVFGPVEIGPCGG